jgi:hypothetical protein
MSKVIATAAMSLDGFIADTGGQVGPLFDFYNNGDVAFTGADPNRVFHLRGHCTHARFVWNLAVEQQAWYGIAGRGTAPG